MPKININNTSTYYETTGEGHPAARPDLTERLSEINQPVLIIVGEREVAAPRYISEEMHRRIHCSQLVVLPDCNHVCIEEQPDIFNSIVSEFLYTVESV